MARSTPSCAAQMSIILCSNPLKYDFFLRDLVLVLAAYVSDEFD